MSLLYKNWVKSASATIPNGKRIIIFSNEVTGDSVSIRGNKYFNDGWVFKSVSEEKCKDFETAMKKANAYMKAHTGE